MSFTRSAVLAFVSLATSLPTLAQSFSFSTGVVNGQLAMASRPASTGKTEREAADDFVLDSTTALTGASFTGLIVGTGVSLQSVEKVVVDIYRLFPADSDTTRGTSVPTRTNSPSDVAFASLSSGTAGGLAFSASLQSPSFTANNSVLNGINPSPNQKTGGDGPVAGSEVTFDLVFSSPLVLAADHYFFVPQVQLSDGEFYWLSAATGSVFSPDLQTWVRGNSIAPDWLRVGTDIIGAPVVNAAFSLSGHLVTAIPEPGTWAQMLVGLMVLPGSAIGSRRAAERHRKLPSA